MVWVFVVRERGCGAGWLLLSVVALGGQSAVELLAQKKKRKLIFCGHSLGRVVAALATLAILRAIVVSSQVKDNKKLEAVAGCIETRINSTSKDNTPLVRLEQGDDSTTDEGGIEERFRVGYSP
uniref:Fungal lipase-type domain-containing protein n=1 Tax=Chenopodium quinoa TaxID=63459 RepID=A0A803N4Y2_CHEQI